MPAVFAYHRVTDNVAGLATWAAFASGDTSYPATNVPLFTDLNIGNPGKLTIKTAGGWTADYGSAQRIDGVTLWHNADAGQTVQIQGNATNSWGSPTFSATFTLPAVREDGFHVKLFADLTTQAGYSSGGFRWWRIFFPVAGPNNSQNWGIKAMMFPVNRVLDRSLLAGNRMPERHRVIRMTTVGGVSWRYDLQDAPRSIMGTILATRQGTSWADMISLWRSAGGSYGVWNIVPDQTIQEAWLVRFNDPDGDGPVLEEMDIQQASPGIQPMQVTFTEISGGGPEWL